MDMCKVVRQGSKSSKSDYMINRKFKKGGSLEKGKRSYVRSSKKRTFHNIFQYGKLVLEKQQPVFSRDATWSSSSDTDEVERRLGNFGFEKGECSKLKVVGQGNQNSDEPNWNRKDNQILKGGLQLNLSSNSQRPNDDYSNPSQQRPTLKKAHSFSNKNLESDMACSINKEQRLVSMSDREGRLFSVPLKGPIQLPVTDAEGFQIRGSDLQEVPLMVELAGSQRLDHNSYGPGKKAGSYWNLEEEFAKVIERGVELGHIIKRREKTNEEPNGKEEVRNHSHSPDANWNLDEEVTKVIEVGLALGFDFNGKEVEI